MSIKSSSNHLLDDFFQIVSSYSKNFILFLYAFFYFPSLLRTFVFFESYHRYMTGRPERKKNKTSGPSRLKGGVVFASIYVKYSMEVEGGFPRPYSSIFFR